MQRIRRQDEGTDSALVQHGRSSVSLADAVIAKYRVMLSDAWSVWLQPLVHYGFIPCIVILGMTCTEPRPTLLQLLGPM